MHERVSPFVVREDVRSHGVIMLMLSHDTDFSLFLTGAPATLLLTRLIVLSPAISDAGAVSEMGTQRLIR